MEFASGDIIALTISAGAIWRLADSFFGSTSTTIYSQGDVQVSYKNGFTQVTMPVISCSCSRRTVVVSSDNEDTVVISHGDNGHASVMVTNNSGHRKIINVSASI